MWQGMKQCLIIEFRLASNRQISRFTLPGEQVQISGFLVCGTPPTFNLQRWPYQLFQVGIQLTSPLLWPGAVLCQSLYCQHLFNDLSIGSKRRWEQMYAVIRIAGLAQVRAPLTGSRGMPVTELEAHNPVRSLSLTNSVLLFIYLDFIKHRATKLYCSLRRIV